MPSRPREELLIALAGPAVTVAIIAVLYLALLLGRVSLASAAQTHGIWLFLAQVMWVNVILAIFNLLPAFPMDGGRVLRAALAMRTSFEHATEIAARLGKGFALLFALFGLFVVNNPFLVIIGVFVWLSAAAESSAAQLKMTVGNVAVSKAMITDVRTLAPTESVSAAIEEVRHGFQHDFPVVDHDNIAGVLTREGLLRAMAEGHADETGRRGDAEKLLRDDAGRVPRAGDATPSGRPLPGDARAPGAPGGRPADGGEDPGVRPDLHRRARGPSAA